MGNDSLLSLFNPPIVTRSPTETPSEARMVLALSNQIAEREFYALMWSSEKKLLCTMSKRPSVNVDDPAVAGTPHMFWIFSSALPLLPNFGRLNAIQEIPLRHAWVGSKSTVVQDDVARLSIRQHSLYSTTTYIIHDHISYTYTPSYRQH